jgi:mono/diheme cytochrome c family protein
MNSHWQNARKNAFVVLFTLVAFLSSSVAYAQIDGKALFKTNCSSCHKATEEKSIGPGLKGVLDRIPGGNWKYDWVHNSADLVKSGESYANKIYNENGKSNMTAFPALSNEQIDAILVYAHKGDGPPKPPTSVDSKTTSTSGSPWFLWVIIIIVLVIMIAVLRYAKINLRNAANEKEGLPEQPSMPFLEASRHWMEHHKRKVALIGLIIMAVGVGKCWYGTKAIGVYAEEVSPGKWVGYHPSQPINFSHKIHAGENAIQCQYCHSGVEKSKTAGIPSAMVCMNCHKAITSTGNPGSKEEIAKIYFAVGWDPEKQAYVNEEHPIQWNKVHVLPDHVFFSHQQHVVVGKQDCSTCHGEVKEMTTVEQQRPLTMGWCIDCHRTTPVDMKEDANGTYTGNGYYEELHAKMKEKYKGQPITVSMVGGIECARCHY